MDGPGIDPFQSRSCEVDPWESDSQRTNSQDMMWWCSVVVFFVGLLSLRKRMLKRPHQGNAGRHGSWLLALGSWLFLCQGDAFGQLASLGLRGKRPSATGSFQEIHWHPPRVRLDVFDTETRIGAKTSGPFSYRTGSVLYENGSLWFSTMKNWVCFLVSVGFFVYLILEGILGHGNVFARRTSDGSEPDLKYLRK